MEDASDTLLELAKSYKSNYRCTVHEAWGRRQRSATLNGTSSVEHPNHDVAHVVCSFETPMSEDPNLLDKGHIVEVGDVTAKQCHIDDLERLI